MANPLGNNGGRFYSYLNRPILIDCNFTVASTDTAGLGITGLKGMGVKNVFMHTTQTAGTNRGYTNPNPLAGFALVQLDANYNRFCGSFHRIAPPNTGSNLAINGSALTAHQPYVITAVGSGPAGVCTIAPVADSSGSLASTWFSLYDSYGQTFILWFSVDGVGKAPTGVAGILVQQSIHQNDTAATIGAALVNTINNLASAPGSATMSFTSAGTTTVTATSTATVPLSGPPADGAIATGFTFALTRYSTNLQCWQGVGLPPGITPAVGVSFFATATGFSTGGGSTGTVKLPSVSGNLGIEVVGNPTLSLAPGPTGYSARPGGFVTLQFLTPTVSVSAYDTPMIPTAPADGSQVYLGFYVEAGSVVIDGE